MPLAFSIFSSKRSSGTSPSAPLTQPVDSAEQEIPPQPEKTETAEQQDTFLSPFLKLGNDNAAKSPFPASTESSERTEMLAPPPSLYHPTPEPLSWLPLKRESSGLAAMVVNQSATEAPPLNRRPSAKSIPGLSPFPTETKESPPPDLLPPASPFMTAPESPAPFMSIEGLQQELQEEISQVRNDLFGAVMGVSALKDRLDDLENTTAQSITPPPPPPIDRAEIESCISAWLETHLPAVLDQALARLEDKTHGSISTNTWFRQPVHFQSADRHTLFTQAPVVISTTPV